MNHVFRLHVFCQTAYFIKIISSLGPFHPTPDKFENEIFTLKIKCVKRFPCTLCWINLKTETVIGHFGFVFQERSQEKSSFKNSNFKMSSVHTNAKPAAFLISNGSVFVMD